MVVAWILVTVPCLWCGAHLGLVDCGESGREGLLRGGWFSVLALLIGTSAVGVFSSSPSSSSELSTAPLSSSSSSSASGSSAIGSWGPRADGRISLYESGLLGARILGRLFNSSHLFSSSSKLPGSPMFAMCDWSKEDKILFAASGVNSGRENALGCEETTSL